MSSYRRIDDGGIYPPPPRPYHQPPSDVDGTELHPISQLDRSRSPSLHRSDGGAPPYETRYDPRAARPTQHQYSLDDDSENSPLKGGEAVLKTYKRRYWGLAELILLNFATGWGYAAPGVVATTATEWFGITYTTLNSLSIASSLVFLVPAPFVIWVLNRHGPKRSIIIAAILTVLGNWIVYAATRAKNFPGNVVGTIISSLAAPFVMSAPTRYSRLWFSDRSRTIATAAQALAYPLGAGFGALTGPYMVEPIGPMDYAGQALIIAIVFTGVSAPVFFIPKEPPTPPSMVAAAKTLGVRASIKSLLKNKPFYILLVAYSVLAGSIDCLTATTVQAIVPYGYTQQSAGFALAAMIFIGLFSALIVSPVLDRTKRHTLGIKILATLIALLITVLPFVIETGSMPGLFLTFALIGICLLPANPAIMETQASWTHPGSPEFSSFICGSGAKVVAAVFTIIAGNVLMLDTEKNGKPEGSIFYGQIFVAVCCWATVPLLLFLGKWKFARPEVSKV